MREAFKLESKIMKTKSYIVCLLLLFGAATNAFGLAGELKEPGLAFPEGFSESARTNILASLRRPDSTFLGGHFISSFTSLKYGGETLALNLFLEGLAKCPGVVLSVRFQNEGIPDDSDWMVSHMGALGDPGRLTVRVNLKSSRISLEKLVIPESKGPPLSDAK
jgi:hypothetical protein